MLWRKEWRLLWPFYMMELTAAALSVALPVWVVFVQHRFSFFQISIAVSLQAIAGLLLEIPTGAFADTFGRKYSVVSGYALQACAWFAVPYVDSPLLLYATFVLMGGAGALQSGAEMAWIVDWLKWHGKPNLVHDMLIKSQSLVSIGLVLASLFGSLLLVFLEVEVLFFIQGFGYLAVAVFLLLFSKEHHLRRRRVRTIELVGATASAMRDGVGYLLHHRRLLYLVLASAFAVCAKDFGCLAWQPLFVDLALPVQYLGIVFSIVSLAGIVTPFFSKRLLAGLGHERRYLALTTFAECTLLLTLYFVHKPLFLLAGLIYLLVSVLGDLQSPVSTLCFQSMIPSNVRATLGSVQSMIFAVFSLASTTVGGYLMEHEGPRIAVMLSALYLIPAALCYLRMHAGVPAAAGPAVADCARTNLTCKALAAVRLLLGKGIPCGIRACVHRASRPPRPTVAELARRGGIAILSPLCGVP